MNQSAFRDVRVAAKGGVIRFLGFGINRGIGVLFVAFAARLLGPAGFGLYRQIASLLDLLGNFGAFGFHIAALRGIAHARAENDPGGVRGVARISIGATILISLLLLALVLTGAEAIAGPFAETDADAKRLARLLRLGAPFIPLYATGIVLQASTRAYQTVTPSVVVGNIVQPTSLFIISVAALLLGYGVGGAVTGLTASALIALVAAVWYFRRILAPAERTARPSARIGPLVRFAAPQAGVSLFRLGASGPGVILMGLFGSDREVGLFAIAASLLTLATVFSTSMLAIWSPIVADLYHRGEIERLGSLYQTVNRWIASSSFVMIAMLMVQPEFFVRLLGGREASGAAVLTSILAVGTLFQVGTGPCAELISMAGWPGVNLLISVVGLGFYVLLAWLVVPTGGAIGMAIVTAAILALTNLARVIQARLLIGIQPFGRSFLKPVVAATTASLVLGLWRALPEKDMIFVGIGLALAASVHVLALLVMGIDPEERIVIERVRARILRYLRREPMSDHR